MKVRKNEREIFLENPRERKIYNMRKRLSLRKVERKKNRVKGLQRKRVRTKFRERECKREK